MSEESTELTSTEESSGIKQRFLDHYERVGWKRVVIEVVVAYMILMVILTYITPINWLQQVRLIVVKASTYILISVGLTMTTRVRKFGNFAQAEFVTFGLYIAYATTVADNAWAVFMSTIFGPTIFGQMLGAFLFTGILGMLGELIIFGPLIRRKANRLSLMTASIGFGIIIRQVLQEIYTGSLKQLTPQYPDFMNTIGDSFVGKIPILGWFFVERTKIDIIGSSKTLIISQNDMWTILVMVLTVFILNLIFKRTTLGISMRATSDDAELAQITGINTDRVNYYTWFIAAGVTGMGALWRYTDSAFQPATGTVVLLIIFAVVVLGGFDSFEGTLVAGFLVALAESYTSIANQFIFSPLNKLPVLDFIIFWTPERDWTQAVPFLIIIVMLLFRPRGLMGVVDPKSKL